MASAFDDPSVQASRGSEKVNPFDDIEQNNYTSNAPVDTPVETRPTSSSVDGETRPPRLTSGSVVASGSINSNKPPPPSTPAPRRKGLAMRMCTLWRVPIYIHFTMPLIFLVDVINSIRFDDSFIVMCMFLILDTMLFFSVLLHEFGHVAATRMVGGETTAILLWPLGGLTYSGHAGGHRKQILVSIAGPLTHVPQILIWAFVLAATYGFWGIGLWYIPIRDYFGRNIVAGAFFQQLLLFLFNLFVPAYPLDGGCILANILVQHYDLKTTAKIMVFISTPIGIGMAIYGGIESWMMTVLVGVYICYQALSIWQAMSNNTLNNHPLFLSAHPNDPPLATQEETAPPSTV